MFKNYLITTLRAFYKRKGGKGGGVLFNYINILGLAIGLAAFLVIAHIINYERSFDKFFANSQNIYRMAVKKIEEGTVTMESARSYPGLGALLKNEIPEIVEYTRLYKEECMLHYKEEDIKFNRQYTFWADRSFASMFNLDFVLQGNLDLMDKPWTAIISESAAKRFFGSDWEEDKSPIGKTLWLNENLGFGIQGVYKDLPENSHMQVDFIVSWATLVTLSGPMFENSLPPDWNSTYMYFQFTPDASKEKIEMMAKKILDARIPELASSETQFEFYFQPVEDIHLRSNILDELRPNGSHIFVYSMMVAAILVLVIAWINFINLTTARALDRTKEVGVRKAIGSTKGHLVVQFVFEALFASVLAGILAIGIVFLLGDKVRDITHISTPVISIEGRGLVTLILFAAIIIFGGILSSLYPAFGLSSLKTTDVIKGKIGTKPGKGYLRKSLIAFQFFFAVFLLSGTVVIYQQVEFMRNQSLGMSPEQVVVLHSPRSMIGNEKRISYFNSLRDKLLPFPDVVQVGASGCIPGNEFLVRMSNVRQLGEEENYMTFDVSNIDEGYLPTLGIDLLSGRNFKDQPGERGKVIINETASKALAFSSPEKAIDMTILVGNMEYQIAGVTEDTHYEGLQKPINPMVLFYGHDYEFGYFPIKIESSQIQETMATIESKWEEIYPNDPFDYFFLDTFFDEQYSNDQAFQQLFGFFSLLAIFIACLGLIGLVAFTTYRKTKEIGIRKVLGANVWKILGLLTGEFSKPILIACVIAIPVTHYAILKWLEDFAYQYDFSWWMHLIPLAVINLLALLAISWQTLKAAFSNPVHAIREE